MNLTVLLPLLLALAAAPATLLAGSVRTKYAAPTATLFSALTLLAVLWGWSSGGGTLEATWIPSWDVTLTFALDGLGALYALLATGVGLAVLLYASAYLPLHLEHEGQAEAGSVRFFFFITLFMGAMVGLALAQDLILIFVFWDLTAIASYYLIGFDNHNANARASALMALLITGVSAVLFLIGAVFLYTAYGTFSVPELVALAEPGRLLTLCTLLIAVAGLVKSAQVPLHFWLPRAMAAPTPVSAYLHSAAMVAAGVFLIGRIYPLVQESPVVLDVLLVVGFLSIATGGVLALSRDVLKQLLAYSTIAQYGFVVAMYGLGGPYGAGGAAFYVVAHALAKSALFLTAGTVTEGTGENRLSKLGGLWRQYPLLAVSSALAGATLTSLPLTLGFFADEFFFAAALARGPLFTAFAVFAAATTLAYTWHFWSSIFLGRPGAAARPVPKRLVLPIAALSLLSLVGGFVTAPFEHLAEAAGQVSFLAPTPLDASYHAELLPEYLMAVAAYGLGVLLIVTRPFWLRWAQSVSELSERLGPERLYSLSVQGLNRFSDAIHWLELRNLRSRLASILLPTALLVGAGILSAPGIATFHIGRVELSDVPLVLAFVVVAAAAVTALFMRDHLTLALAISSSGFVLALIYALYGAPNVALVAVLVETTLTILLIATLRLIPPKVLAQQAAMPSPFISRKIIVTVIAGLFAFAVAWSSLSQPPAGQTIADEHIRLTPDAHARNVVTATLADFRGLDTLGEITVVILVLIGVGTLFTSIVPAQRTGALEGADAPLAREITRGVARILYLPIFMIAAALLVKGFVETGDGFSAGVVAALGVLLRYLAFGYEETKRLLVVRHATTMACAGLFLALAVAAAPLFFGSAVLTHYPPAGVSPIHLGTLELMTAVLFDIGIFVLVLGFIVGVMSYFAAAGNSVPDVQQGEHA